MTGTDQREQFVAALLEALADHSAWTFSSQAPFFPSRLVHKNGLVSVVGGCCVSMRASAHEEWVSVDSWFQIARENKKIMSLAQAAGEAISAKDEEDRIASAWRSLT